MDNFYRFWFRFIYRNLSILESNPSRLVKIIRKQMPPYLGVVYEDVAKEFLTQFNMAGELPFSLSEIGRWWHREEEIDIVALDRASKDIAFFEVKWSRIGQRDANRILNELRHKAEHVKWHNHLKREYFGIIAKKIETKRDLQEEGYLAYDLEDLEALPYI
jgi:hypothetical protein